MVVTVELSLEKSLGLRSGNKYNAQSKLQIPALQSNNVPSLTTLTNTVTHLVKSNNVNYHHDPSS